jgi:hypothetical protein
MRLMLAFRAFFRVLFSAMIAEQVRAILAGESVSLEQPPAPSPTPNLERKPADKKPADKKPAPPSRSEAITLLAALQREARLIDIVREPLGDYSDAQIGAAARDVLRDCGQVLERMFALQPVVTDQEGAELDVPAGFDNGCYRLVGNVTGEPPFRGKLVHHGWKADKCELPSWSGSGAASLVIAAAEVELK